MKNIVLITLLVFSGFALIAQTNLTSVHQNGKVQFAETDQIGNSNTILIQQVSSKKQSAWVFQSGEIEDHETGIVSTGGEDNFAYVDQQYGGDGNVSFLDQYGSHNRSIQTQKGKGNQFNIVGSAEEGSELKSAETDEVVPNQDGDYHIMSQYAEGNQNQAWVYQAGRQSNASQAVIGNFNEVWTSQSGNTQTSVMVINGNRNGSHYLLHGEGKFPHDESEEETEHDESEHGNGKSGNSGGNSEEGGKPEVIPPIHDEDHVFVPTVGVSIKQMGKGSYANMFIEGDDNKATIKQRGGDGGDGGQGEGKECEGGQIAYQSIFGDWNRIFADQRGTHHTNSQYVSGNYNLVTSMQRGNGSISSIDLGGNANEIGVDQKGKSNFSDVDVSGNFNGNFDNLVDEFGVKILQEGKGNYSDLDIAGNFNFVNVQQGSGALSIVSQSGNWHTVNVTQSSLDEH